MVNHWIMMNHYATCILDLAGSSTNHLDTRSLCGQNICSTPSAGLPCSTMPFAALVGSTHCWRVFRFSSVSSVIVIWIDDWLFLGQKDRIGPIGILPWSSACVECHTHCCRSPWQSQMFASQYRHGQGMMVPNFSWARLCSALSGPWQHMTSGGLQQRRLLQPRRPKPPEQLRPQWRHWKQPSKRRSKENFFQRDQRMEKLPRWERRRMTQERKGCCDILMFRQVSICFNLQFRDDITMWTWCRIMQDFVILTNGCNFWCTRKCFWLWSRSVVQKSCMKCLPLQMYLIQGVSIMYSAWLGPASSLF